MPFGKWSLLVDGFKGISWDIPNTIVRVVHGISKIMIFDGMLTVKKRSQWNSMGRTELDV